MKPMRSLWMVPALVLLGAPAPRAAKPATAAEVEELRKVVYDMWTAWDSVDPAKVAQYYSQDPANVFYDVSPLKFQGWKEYAEIAAKMLAGTASAKWSPTGDFKVIKEGGLAVTTLTMNVVFTRKDGNAGRAQVRDTGVWEKQGGKWVMLHQHTSIPSAGPQPPANQKNKK